MLANTDRYRYSILDRQWEPDLLTYLFSLRLEPGHALPNSESIAESLDVLLSRHKLSWQDCR